MTEQIQNTSLSLVADVGGTNTRFALALGVNLIEETVRRYRNAEHPEFDDVLQRYLLDLRSPKPTSICIAVAGPVSGDEATLTNLNWTISRERLTNISTVVNFSILNDLQAQGYALNQLDPSNLRTIISGTDAPVDGTKLMVGVGTGFNSAPVFRSNGGLLVPPSETGHACLSAISSQDSTITQSLTDAHGFPAVEEVLSGRGLEKVYSYFAKKQAHKEQVRGAEVIQLCSTGEPIANEAVAYFIKVLGNTCGDLALIQLPVGGIYLVGGVSRAIASFLEKFEFERAFQSKGRFTDFMKQFPVYVIEDDYAALNGCAAFLVEKSNKLKVSAA